jgi:hypothetical protein
MQTQQEQVKHKDMLVVVAVVQLLHQPLALIPHLAMVVLVVEVVVVLVQIHLHLQVEIMELQALRIRVVVAEDAVLLELVAV